MKKHFRLAAEQVNSQKQSNFAKRMECQEIIDICLHTCPYPHDCIGGIDGCDYFLKKKREILNSKKVKAKK